MSVTIIRCPSCKSMLLSDTAQCPSCQHILDEEAHRRWREEATDTVKPVAREEPCAKCGEMVRIGLVRCWNCSAFMQADIAEAYRQMQASPQPVIYSQLPAAEPDVNEFELGATYGVQRLPEELADTPQETPPNPAARADSDTPPPSSGQIPDSASRDADDDEDAVPHSIATGGDALLDVALSEQEEEKRRKRARKKERLTGPRSASGMMVFCPNGHRIEVEQRYIGMTGRCPKCRLPFFVPPPDKPAGDAVAGEGEATDAAAEATTGKFTRWMTDVHVHSVNPERLKLKPGSLKAEYQLFDLGFAEDEIVIAAFTKRKGAAPGKTKKQQADREALHEYLKTGGPLSDAPVAEHFTLNAEQAAAITVAQPALYPHESLFADVPVFGNGWIAVRLPITDDPKIRRFASFTLTGFREFAAIVESVFGMSGLGEDVEIPLTDSFKEAKCHYSEAKIEFLDPVEYYEADPSLDLKLVGRKCAACGLVISEESRKKEKIGGVNGKAIAKAKCPKCQQKFGTTSLYTLESPPPAESQEQTQPEEAGAAG